MPFHLLYPDVLSADNGAVERAIVGDGIAFDIHGEIDPDQIPDEVWSRAQAFVTGLRMPITETVIARAPNLKIISRLGVGYDLIDIDAAAERGVAVCNVPDYGTNEVADHAIGLLLSFTRGIVRYNDLFRESHDGWGFANENTVVRMAGRKLGIIGMGRIGTACALRGKCFGMDVCVYDPYLPDGQELAIGVTRYESLSDFLNAVDFISIHAPLTVQTHHLIGHDAVAQMKPGTILVNTARGPICDLDAVYEGLKTGQIGAAGLDVFPDEPPSSDNPLLKAWRAGEPWIHGRLILTPHAAFYSADGMKFLREKAAMTAVNYLRHGVLRNCVNGITQ